MIRCLEARVRRSVQAIQQMMKTAGVVQSPLIGQKGDRSSCCDVSWTTIMFGINKTQNESIGASRLVQLKLSTCTS